MTRVTQTIFLYINFFGQFILSCKSHIIYIDTEYADIIVQALIFVV